MPRCSLCRPKITNEIGIVVRCAASGSGQPKQESIEAAIPEFLRHNIVEAEIRNVC